jgi:oligoribonuclease NrnB/cAMP/cGMP phosphodiesterase (DHH superfamily)
VIGGGGGKMHKKIVPSPSDVDFVIYHASCSDGFGARFAAELLLGIRATYHAAKHGDLPPDVRNKNVVIVDFSYDSVTTKRLIEDANTLIVLDHHKSALVELSDIPNVRFDMDKSGAILSWEFFHPGKQPPRFLEYIQDRDLWKWKLPYSREFSAAFDMVDFDYEEYEKFLTDSVVDSAQERGAYILAYSKTVISKIAKHAAPRKIDGKDVLVVNSPHWMSEIGNALSTKCDYALIWYYDHDTRQVKVSLRAHHDDADVSEVAKRFGGGGHRKAAGFALPPGVSIESIFEGARE